MQMVVIFAFHNHWYYFTSAYYVKLLHFFTASYYGWPSSLSILKGSQVQGQRFRASGKLLTNSCTILAGPSWHTVDLLLHWTNPAILCIFANEDGDRV